MNLLVFECSKDDEGLLNGFRNQIQGKYEEISIDRLNAMDVVLVSIPLAVALISNIPEIAKAIKELFGSPRVKILLVGPNGEKISLSVMGYEKGMDKAVEMFGKSLNIGIEKQMDDDIKNGH